MGIWDIVAILISLTAFFSYLNHRYLRLPTAIGVMLMGMLMSLGIVALNRFGSGMAQEAQALIKAIDFNDTLMHGMLSFLLFAGALHVNLGDLAKQKWVVATLATFGIVMSTFIIGGVTWCILNLLGFEFSFVYALVFGALISPTDPIAVLAILRKSGASKELETKITGESLFNDGVGVVVFMTLVAITLSKEELTAGSIAWLFTEEAGGGIVYGLVVGALAHWMLKSIDNYQVEILITLAVVTGGYALAMALHLSGPIAIVVAGLMIGNHGRLLAMSEKTREHLDMFWELLDEILNALLFVLIGLEIIVVSGGAMHVVAGLLAIIIVLGARFISVAIPITIMRRFREFSPNAIKILTWGGLRGGISVALALSLPPSPERDLILGMTYCVVIFSIVVQGLTIAKLVARNPIEPPPSHA